MNRVSDIIRERLIGKGASIVGFADLSEISGELRYNLRYGISIGKSIDPKIVNNIYKGPNLEYYEEYKRLNNKLDKIAILIADDIKDMGHNAIAKTTTEVRIDNTTKTSDLPHKTVATRSGLGWIGKNAMLITEEYGSAIRLTTVLTDLQLEVGEPINESRCGSCNRCERVCSGKAIKGINWNIGLRREEFYDAYACRKEARRLSGIEGIDESLCGLCIHACRYTKKYIKSQKIKVT
ncbi:epoxyqueuosine reductase [Clostridium sp. D2Q-14]|uniref:epoxyqueuosine reductase n=1 Tax=Anaeromonas gelatinilytica TaxID=2683194 RepID=UPI00193B4C1B|nr:epoxyqueuosine reductase [Anaeromonas gelatinilytica]MBS4535707.1 epoxyqueuosine reductase [Anaeromonas gelatinilytica]